MSRLRANVWSPQVMSNARWPALVKSTSAKPDDHGVFAGRQIGHGQREIRPVNFLAKRFLAAFWRAGDGQAFMSPAVFELAADQHLPVAGDAGFLVGQGDRG